MNRAAVRKHILEELAHGMPIQSILNPQPPQIEATDPETGAKTLHDDPEFVRPDLPDWNMVVSWLQEDEEFRNQWEAARKFGAQYNADQMLILKDRLLKDPKNAPAYKTAMEMIKTAAMWGDSKFSDRTISEIKDLTPQNSEAVRARIAQLEEELELKTVDVIAHAPAGKPVKKERTPAQQAHVAKLQAGRQLAYEKKKRGIS